MNAIVASRRAGGSAGFSLVEMMVAMTVTLIIMAGVFALMIQNQGIYEAETQSADMQQSLRVSLDLIVRELRQAGRDVTTFAFDADHQEDGALCPNVPALADPLEHDQRLLVADANRIRVRADLPQDFDGDGKIEDSVDGSGTVPADGPASASAFESGDGCINDIGEDVEYSFADSPDPAVRSTLYRTMYSTGTGTPTVQPIADMLTVVSFEYFTGDMTPVTPGTEFAPMSAADRATIRTVRVTLEATAKKRRGIGDDFAVYRVHGDVELRNLGDQVKDYRRIAP